MGRVLYLALSSIKAMLKRLRARDGNLLDKNGGPSSGVTLYDKGIEHNSL